MEVWLMDAFTTKVFGGNPAGVVPDARGLSVHEMQVIANELHASETAFVLPASAPGADMRIRYFTPSREEVNLCGHATIGTVCGLVSHGYFGDNASGTCHIETNVGVLPVKYYTDNGAVWAEMGQARPEFKTVPLDPEEVARMLGVRSDEIHSEYPIGFSYTGLWDLFVPLTSIDAMCRMTPQLSELARWNEQLRVGSTHVYTPSAVQPENHYHTRDFAPAMGIVEDPVTGTATGALLALLHHAGVAQADVQYRFEQGYEMGRPGVLSARIEDTSDGPAVYVGGNAVCSMEGIIRL